MNDSLHGHHSDLFVSFCNYTASVSYLFFSGVGGWGLRGGSGRGYQDFVKVEEIDSVSQGKQIKGTIVPSIPFWVLPPWILLSLPGEWNK